MPVKYRVVRAVFRRELRRLCANEFIPASAPEQEMAIDILCQAFADLSAPPDEKDTFRLHDRRFKRTTTINVRADAEHFFATHRLRPFALALECDMSEIRAAKDRALSAEVSTFIDRYLEAA